MKENELNQLLGLIKNEETSLTRKIVSLLKIYQGKSPVLKNCLTNFLNHDSSLIRNLSRILLQNYTLKKKVQDLQEQIETLQTSSEIKPLISSQEFQEIETIDKKLEKAILTADLEQKMTIEDPVKEFSVLKSIPSDLINNNEKWIDENQDCYVKVIPLIYEILQNSNDKVFEFQREIYSKDSLSEFVEELENLIFHDPEISLEVAGALISDCSLSVNRASVIMKIFSNDFQLKDKNIFEILSEHENNSFGNFIKSLLETDDVPLDSEQKDLWRQEPHEGFTRLLNVIDKILSPATLDFQIEKEKFLSIIESEEFVSEVKSQCKKMEKKTLYALISLLLYPELKIPQLKTVLAGIAKYSDPEIISLIELIQVIGPEEIREFCSKVNKKIISGMKKNPVAEKEKGSREDIPMVSPDLSWIKNTHSEFSNVMMQLYQVIHNSSEDYFEIQEEIQNSKSLDSLFQVLSKHKSSKSLDYAICSCLTNSELSKNRALTMCSFLVQSENIHVSEVLKALFAIEDPEFNQVFSRFCPLYESLVIAQNRNLMKLAELVAKESAEPQLIHKKIIEQPISQAIQEQVIQVSSEKVSSHEMNSEETPDETQLVEMCSNLLRKLIKTAGEDYHNCLQNLLGVKDNSREIENLVNLAYEMEEVRMKYALAELLIHTRMEGECLETLLLGIAKFRDFSFSEVFITMLDFKTSQRKGSAILALGELGDRENLSILFKNYVYNTDTELDSTYIRALRKHSKKELMDLTVNGLNENSVEWIKASLNLLKTFSEQETLDILEEFISEYLPSVDSYSEEIALLAREVYAQIHGKICEKKIEEKKPSKKKKKQKVTLRNQDEKKSSGWKKIAVFILGLIFAGGTGYYYFFMRSEPELIYSNSDSEYEILKQKLKDQKALLKGKGKIPVIPENKSKSQEYNPTLEELPVEKALTDKKTTNENSTEKAINQENKQILQEKEKKLSSGEQSIQKLFQTYSLYVSQKNADKLMELYSPSYPDRMEMKKHYEEYFAIFESIQIFFEMEKIQLSPREDSAVIYYSYYFEGSTLYDTMIDREATLTRVEEHVARERDGTWKIKATFNK